MYQLLALPFLATAALAAPLLDDRQAGPSVAIKDGTVIGSSSGGVDSFRGV